jgi:LPXTG-site transpeptidase (sortase) family protein
LNLNSFMQRGDFYTIYQLDALGYANGLKKSSFWLTLLQASGIFVLITFIVFAVANYQFIKSQLLDWQKEKKSQIAFIEDKDEDDVPDWWEEKYGLNGKDPSDSNKDNDNDGANNLTEFSYQTNPLDPDSDRDGYFDGEEIANGFNPNGSGRLDADEDGMPDWWEEKFAMNKNDSRDANLDSDGDGLSNIDEFSSKTNPNKNDSDSDKIADGKEVAMGLNPLGEGSLSDVSKNISAEDVDGDGLNAFYENLFGLDPQNPDSDSDGHSDEDELMGGFDPSGEGTLAARLKIPSLSVDAPIVFPSSEDQDVIEKGLEGGVIHYPGTAFFGMRGNTYLTGHSSYYAWSTSKYKEVLKTLDKSAKGDKAIISLSFKNGKNVDFVYIISDSEVVLPNDPNLFRDYEGYELTLVTCWPIGTDWKRLMVKADLSYPKPD